MSASAASVDELHALIAQHEAQIELLNAELAETNLGVVALYSELEDKAAQLRDAAELKSRFLSYISHEFKTPLSSIRSIARILLDELDGPLGDEQKRQVGFIQTSAVELTDMVGDLLDLARVEAGKINISPAWFEMVDLFSTLRGMFKPLVGDTAVALIFEEPVGLDRVYTDDRKLSQIMRNFIANALKFTSEGEVRVSAKAIDGDRVEFSVSDTGIGIAPEYQSALFQDFTQVDSPIQKRFRGAGLGLALSKKFAELLGGEVGVVSEVGRGSCFWVRLPMRLKASVSESPE
ncbi:MULTISPECIES: sensor histidine kinase [Hydrocarboniphaga]|jgi:signal transduction histidine kinase|uniref:histidine kinase n=1 Tax=Hydrocarboniphaga effusa AP103 TaxID=1172194 RepID=I8T191_9GAMM|nr:MULTISPECIES: HAMP domain-containing sensor histidine kinase [Hydrocarboniphaga]EIT67660.1 histidine kinase [Hydrocarboniphaga effusa AP103]MDZ4080244.1 HAMP domain-containing sensor histidine kinase [Hydrocarboniphaga sp.]